MALNVSQLKGAIKQAFDTAKTKEDEQQQAIDALAEGIASAVIGHIKSNLQVTSQGPGNNGAPVISNSTIIN